MSKSTASSGCLLLSGNNTHPLTDSSLGVKRDEEDIWAISVRQCRALFAAVPGPAQRVAAPWACTQSMRHVARRVWWKHHGLAH